MSIDHPAKDGDEERAEALGERQPPQCVSLHPAFMIIFIYWMKFDIHIMNLQICEGGGGGKIRGESAANLKAKVRFEKHGTTH